MASRDIPIFKRPGSGIWYLRRAIPTRLRQHFPNGKGGSKAELAPISLGTRDERSARKAAAVPWADFQTKLDGLNRPAKTGTAKQFFRELFEQDVQSELGNAAQTQTRAAELESAIEIAELEAAAGDTGGPGARLRDARLKRLRLELLELKRASLKGRRELNDVPGGLDDPQIAAPILDDYIRQFLDRHPLADGEIARSVLHDVIKSEAIKAYGDIGDALDEPMLRQAASPARLPLHNATDLTPSCSVMDYYRNHYRKGRKLRTERGEVGISPDGLDKVKEGARDFTDVIGDLHIAAVTSNHIREFRSVLRRVPTSWRKRAAHREKTLRQIVEAADAEEAKSGQPVPRLSPKTIESTLQGLRSLFKFACSEGQLADNPTRGIREELPTERTYDTNFTVADLNTLFASPWFSGAKGDDGLKSLTQTGPVLVRDHRYWAFLCMLFSGARVAEIGGIRTDQVHLETDEESGDEWGYFEFDWTAGLHGRRLKNASSARCVPPPFRPDRAARMPRFRQGMRSASVDLTQPVAELNYCNEEAVKGGRAVPTSAIELAFTLARTGQFENFTQVKKALRRNFAVERELVGRQLSADITRICKAARAEAFETASRQAASSDGSPMTVSAPE